MPADELTDFGRLVELHYSAVVAVAYATTRDVGIAEDIAQDTFITAWDLRAKLPDVVRIRPWLCSIARNKSRNALRSRRREVAEEHDVADPKPSVVDGAVEREATAELHAALAEVPMTYREPLVLFYWEQKSIAQVASALAISEEAAQKRISRGRSYLRDGLEAPLEGASRGRRTAAAAAAAVLAILATRTGVAHAAAAKPGITMLKAFGLVGLAGLVIGTVAVVRSGSSDAASNDTAARPTPTIRETTRPPREPALPEPAAESTPAMAAPSGYEITVLGPANVAVNLAGGKSEVFLWDTPPAPALERHITGRVVDAASKPISGAVVIVGSRLDAHMGDLSGAGGAVTRADGTFSLTTHEDTAGYAMALHPRGWSAVVSVPAGKGDPKLTLIAPAPGSVAVHVRRAGAPLEATVVITPATGGLTLVHSTDVKGELAIPLLAPGPYVVKTYEAHLATGGTSPPLVSEITVVAGRVVELPIELTTGVLVVASAFKPGMHTVEYFMYPGTEKLEMTELKKRGRAGQILDYLLGGVDADRAAQFHDVAPGVYTLCVDAAAEDKTHLPLVCKGITVTTNTLEVAVDVR